MIAVTGYPTGHGSESSKDDPPAEVDDPLVARFRELGAIILG